MAVVDNTGIEPSTFDDYLAEFIRAAQTVFGAEFAADERGIAGQLFGLLSRRLEGADIGLVDAMNAQDIRVAGGVHLDLLLGLAQVLRGVDDDGDAINDTPYRNRGLRMLGYSGNGAIENISAKVAAVEGVSKERVVANDDSSSQSILSVNIDANSVHAIAFGTGITTQDLVDAIYLGKAPGILTDGTSAGTYTNAEGLTTTINYTLATEIACTSQVNGTVTSAFPSNGQALLRASILAYFAALNIGDTPTTIGIQSAVYGVVPIGSIAITTTTLTRTGGAALGTLTLDDIATLADGDLVIGI